MSIKLRLLLVFIPAMLVLLGLTIYFGTLSEALLISQNRQYIKTIATSYANKFSILAESALTMAETLGDSMESRSGLSDAFVKELLQKDIIERGKGIQGLRISLEPGILGKGEFSSCCYRNRLKGDEVSYKSLTDLKYDYRGRDWYKIPMSTGKGYWTEPYPADDGTGASVITYGAPIIRDGAPIGVAAVDLSMDALAEDLKELKLTEKGHVYLVTTSGTCIGSSRISGTSQPGLWNDSLNLTPSDAKALFDKIGTGKPGAKRLKDSVTGEDILFLIRPVSPLNLNLVFASARNEIRAPILRLNRILAGICVAFILLSVGLIFWVSSSVTRHLDRLVKQAEEYSTGNFKGHLDEKKGAEEIRKLSKAFNVMGQEIARRIHELKEAQKEIVLHLCKAAEYRDPDTGQHIWRMSQYCAVLARACGMSQEEWDLFLHASPMHDIGKIGISDTILLKPGRLDDKEYKVMKTHTTIGDGILSDGKSQLLKIAQIVAHFHHEKWDGSGYPHGLKGEEIPLLARIACIADVFDALTMKRPYKEAWTVEEAVREIESQSGKDFDPHLVALFKENLQEILAIKARFDESASRQAAPEAGNS